MTLFHPFRQLALALAGFLAAIVLLESGGLAHWANQLEVGPLRTVAVPVTATVEKALHPLGVDALRDHALTALARAGWTDDPALLAEAAKRSGARSQPQGNGHASSATANATNSAAASVATSPVPGSGNLYPNAPGAQTPLLADLPHMTALAPLPPVEQGKPRVVALAGDSMMAVGLSAELMREAAADKNLRVVKVFRSGTGLARPEVFNWMDEYPAMLGAEKPDVVIVAIGANDGQGFVVDGKVLPYGSAGWSKVYQERLAEFLAMVGAGGARVVWVGLPPMRVPVYDEKITDLNRIAFTVVSQSPHAHWLNSASYVGDEAGRYREFATLANGRTMRIRATDGIHLSDEGAGLLTTVLLKWLDPPPAQTASGATTALPIQAPPVAKIKHRARRTAKG
ncbi:MAG: DUF459 domain-containing protein [Terracidiphilus sp.]|jgi:hypothetical protein